MMGLTANTADPMALAFAAVRRRALRGKAQTAQRAEPCTV